MSALQVTLGQLLKFLNTQDGNKTIYISNPHSYRGYYCELAIEPTFEGITVKLLIKQLESVRNQHLTGYKGGEFLMDDDTPVWVACEGTTGERLLGFSIDLRSTFTEEDDTF